MNYIESGQKHSYNNNRKQQTPENTLLPEIGIIPPYSNESENYVLGAILIEKNAVTQAIDRLKPEMFYVESNRNIYTACLNLYVRMIPIDLISVNEELKRIELLDASGGRMKVVELISGVASSANIEYHCKIIVEKFILRRLGQLGIWMFKKMNDPVTDPLELLSTTENLIFKLSQQNIRKEMVRAGVAAQEQLAEIRERFKNKNHVPKGIPSGFHEIDSILNRLKGGEFIIIAGRPGMGKTVLGVNVAKNVARYHKSPVALFSLEMSQTQLINRMISGDSGVSSANISSGVFNQYDLQNIEDAVLNIEKDPLVIDDTPAISLLELRTKCRKIMAETGLGMVVIDYLQLMTTGTDVRGRSREQEVGEISRGLKSLSKELDIPVIALAQLGRKVEERADKKPQLSDLRESGSLEMDADVVMFLYRPEYYKITEDEHGESTRNVGFVMIEKNRHGSTGTAKLIFNGPRFRFESFNNNTNENGKIQLTPSDKFSNNDGTEKDGEYSGESDTAPF